MLPLKPIEKYNDQETQLRNKICREAFGTMNTDLKRLTNKEYLLKCKELADKHNIILGQIEVAFYGVFGMDSDKYYQVMKIILANQKIKLEYLENEYM